MYLGRLEHVLRHMSGRYMLDYLSGQVPRNVPKHKLRPLSARHVPNQVLVSSGKGRTEGPQCEMPLKL